MCPEAPALDLLGKGAWCVWGAHLDVDSTFCLLVWLDESGSCPEDGDIDPEA